MYVPPDPQSWTFQFTHTAAVPRMFPKNPTVGWKLEMDAHGPDGDGGAIAPPPPPPPPPPPLPPDASADDETSRATTTEASGIVHFFMSSS
jgi:hypothetical protein